MAGLRGDTCDLGVLDVVVQHLGEVLPDQIVKNASVHDPASENDYLRRRHQRDVQAELR